MKFLIMETINMRDIIDIWFDLLQEEAENGNPIHITKENNPFLYKLSQIIEVAMRHRSGFILEEDEPIYKKYLFQ